MNRLGLAYWLADDANPLTARVVVNRFWGSCSAGPLADTARISAPRAGARRHPLLLDWLATEFVRGGWSMKGIHRTDRDLGHVPSVVPHDARLAGAGSGERPPRARRAFRLPAETIRDVALAASGLLSPKIGGPSVFPPHPAGHVVGSTTGARRTGTVSKGEDAYRRGLYTFWRRTAHYPDLRDL